MKNDIQLSFHWHNESSIRACTGPYASPWSFLGIYDLVLPPGMIVTIGRTVPAEDMIHSNVVEIVSPHHCYVNEYFFSRELGYFEWVA